MHRYILFGAGMANKQIKAFFFCGLDTFQSKAFLLLSCLWKAIIRCFQIRTALLDTTMPPASVMCTVSRLGHPMASPYRIGDHRGTIESHLKGLLPESWCKSGMVLTYIRLTHAMQGSNVHNLPSFHKVSFQILISDLSVLNNHKSRHEPEIFTKNRNFLGVWSSVLLGSASFLLLLGLAVPKVVVFFLLEPNRHVSIKRYQPLEG